MRRRRARGRALLIIATTVAYSGILKGGLGCLGWLRIPCKDTTAPAPRYGAIAYGRTSGAWGSSYQWDSRAKAESTAMQNCKEHGDDCEVMVWFHDKCGAVAATDGDTPFWGLGDSEEQARADAQSKCADGGGRGCEVQASQCSK